MTMFNVTCLAHSDERTENYDPTLQFPSNSTERFSLFLLIILVLGRTLLFWFILTTLIYLVSSSTWQLFSVAKL